MPKTARCVVIVGLATLLSMVVAGNAAAAFSGAEVERAAAAMGVSKSQAAENLEVQAEAFDTIQSLIAAGNDVWFDNKTAKVHVHGRGAATRVPASLERHVVYDKVKKVFRGTSATMTADTCGTSIAWQQYCSPVQPGQRINKQNGSLSRSCTAGFMVRDHATNAPHLLTASHCALWGTTFYANPFTAITWPGQVGCHAGSSVNGVAPWSGADMAIIPMTGGNCGGVAPAIHNWMNGADIPQQGAVNAFVGEYVCHFGVTSLYACGTVFAVDVPTVVDYSASGTGTWTIQHTDQICMYGQPGDSGGPVTDGTYPGAATGIHIASGGGYAPCSSSNQAVSIEQRIFHALGAFNVYVAAS